MHCTTTTIITPTPTLYKYNFLSIKFTHGINNNVFRGHLNYTRGLSYIITIPSPRDSNYKEPFLESLNELERKSIVHIPRHLLSVSLALSLSRTE